MPVKYSFVFNRKKKLNKDGEAIIELVCMLNRRRRYFSTKVWIKPSQWNNDKREVRRSHPKNTLYNTTLNELKLKYEKFEADQVYLFRRQDREFSLQDFNRIGDLNASHHKCFVKFVEFEIARRKNSGKYQARTVKGYNSFLSNLKKFDTKIYFNSMDRSLGRQLKDWANNNFSKQGTIWTFEKGLKSFLNAAVEENIIENDIVKELKNIFDTPSVVKQDPERLSLENFRVFRGLKSSNVQKQMCIDAFLIGCYTGLRISDVLSLSYDNLNFDNDNNVRLEVKVRKGASRHQKRALVLPLHKMFLFSGEDLSEPVKILQHYAGMNKELQNNKIEDLTFFKVSQQYLNRYLKVIAAENNFEIAKLTFHHSRNTFARLLHHYCGQSIGLVKEFLQHTDIKVTMVYETTNEREREELMGQTDWDKIR